jgi:hypothetical protein
MSSEEIRQWLKTLHEEHGWPWETLARTLGIGEGKHAASKVRGNSRIKYGERRRMSRQIARILSGELVPSAPNIRRRVDAKLADNPVPIHGAVRMVYDLQSGRLAWKLPPTPTGPRLPSFAEAIEKLCGEPSDELPPRWREH